MADLKNIQPHKKFKVLLIGDSCLDEYYYGTCDRLNPEAPVPVLKILRRESKPGMAANVKENLESFGCEVKFITSQTQSIKKRYIDERSKQHIVRVDEDYQSDPLILGPIGSTFEKYDAIVISDYDKGFMTYQNVESIRTCYPGPIFIDTKKRDLARFEGCYVKINEQEYRQSISKCNNLIVTLGSRGAQYRGLSYSPCPTEVVDVCGAGDTFLAALTFEFLKSQCMDRAINFANQCASITVRHRGVYSLTQNDLSAIVLE
jgi:D-beta-D-heptose 7-phosphate kinase/D-beta-D-heptose 1-phosphate adenosyltransferase